MNASKVTVPTDHDAAIVEVAPAREGDCMSKKLAAEMQRRLLIFTVAPDQQIVRAQTPPSDKTVYWLPVDQNGKIVGMLKGYDAGSGTWIDVSAVGACISQDPTSLLTLDSQGCMLVAAGNVPGFTEATEENLSQTAGVASVDLEYQGFLDIQAEIGVNFKADPGADSRWFITNRSETGCTVNFAGLANNLAATVFARRSTLPS